MKATLHRVQVLRFAAAAMVLFGHVQLKAREVLAPGTAFETLGHPAFWASGVDVFFVISGFIMYTVARDDFGRPDASRQFFLRRLARIVPPYWLLTTAMMCSILLLPQHVAHDELTADNVLLSYLFIPAPNAYGEPYPVLALGWTLNFEMMFYVLFAAALGTSRRRGIAMLIGVLTGLGIAGVWAAPGRLPLGFWCNPLVFEFLFGILLAHLRASGRRWSGTCGAMLLVLGIALLYFGSMRSEASPLWLGRSLWMGLPALLLCASVVLTEEPASIGPLGRFLALAGDASYALYLIHPFTLAAVQIFWRGIGWQAPWTYVGVSAAFTLVLSLAFHLAFERPVVAWLGAKIKRVRPALPLLEPSR